MTTARSAKLFFILTLALALGTMVLYWPVATHPFIIFDDDDYIVENPHVVSGLNETNVIWAFDGAHAANWHPLTWVSHQADCSLFGTDAGGSHLVNLLFHVANTLLLFLFLSGTTGALWRSAVVAALFAWHPLHVESVAWAAERKDVLSAFFWLLTLLAYAGYARRAASGFRRAWPCYFAALCFFALGLMSKPMVVTLPFVLLLLDIWPLNRLVLAAGVYRRQMIRLLVEKIPFFLLSFAGCLATMHAQTDAMTPVGLASRLMNAVLTYPRYIAKLLWPTDLSIIYPYRSDWPILAVVGAAILLLAISLLAVNFFRSRPWFFVGWFWFLGTLIPTIGIIQVGAAAMADRYSYLPSIGFFCLVIWGVTEYGISRPRGKTILLLLGSSVLLGCWLAASVQITYWRSGISLFLHSLEVTRNNYVTVNCLAVSYRKAGDQARARVLFEESIHIEPRNAQSHFEYAVSLLAYGEIPNAINQLQTAATLDPRNSDFQFVLGVCQSRVTNWPEAARCFTNALALRADFPPAEAKLAAALAQLGRYPEAVQHYHQALKLNPDFPEAKKELAELLAAHPELK